MFYFVIVIFVYLFMNNFIFGNIYEQFHIQKLDIV